MTFAADPTFSIKRNLARKVCALFLCFTALPAWGELKFTTLFSFAATNGTAPIGPLCQARDGNLYGVTEMGGATDGGTVFRFTLDGVFTSVVSLHSSNGVMARAGLMQATDGNFYGTTTMGGAYDKGTVFRIPLDGALTTVVSFDGTNGARPMGELVQGPDGCLYGTTSEAGVKPGSSLNGYGTLFRITLAGTLETLVYFNGTNGGGSCSGLVCSDGALYGTGQLGGLFKDPYSSYMLYGTVFKVTTNGELSTLANFDSTNGLGSQFSLVRGRDGNLYGTTYAGEKRDYVGNGYGNVIRITPSGTLTTLHAFSGPDGYMPRGLVEGSDGNFYAMTGRGGPAFSGSDGGYGGIFRITPDGEFTNLVFFTEDQLPFSALLQASDGNFYGTTIRGGAYGSGSIFRLSVPMAPVFAGARRVGESLALTWSSVAGQRYQLQYASTPDSTGWSDLGGPILATDGTTTALDLLPSNPAQRFYRVVLLP